MSESLTTKFSPNECVYFISGGCIKKEVIDQVTISIDIADDSSITVHERICCGNWDYDLSVQDNEAFSSMDELAKFYEKELDD